MSDVTTMGDVIKRATTAYLRLLRSIALALVAIILFIATGALIVLPLWYVSTHFATFYSIIVPLLILGVLFMLGVRGLQRRAREQRTMAYHQRQKRTGLRLVTASCAALVSVYFGASTILGAGFSALIPALLAACAAGILATGITPSKGPGLPAVAPRRGAGTKDRER
ncbi:MAG: hypothetical protein LC641_11210 [Spirochaeta sp.]|nr:hypothetical protein [Spirochaeta sp.]